MKKIIMKTFAAGIVAVMFFTSCMKSHTCTCKDNTGKVMSTQKNSTTSKSSADAFKTSCLSQSTQTTANGIVTSTTPCEYQ